MYGRENALAALRAWRRHGARGLGHLGLAYACKRLEPDHVPVLPSMLHLEVTNRCNLRCFTCARASSKGGADLSLEQVRHVLDAAPGAAKVNLYGIGEPLLNRDLVPMLREARRRQLYVGFFTNLTLLGERAVRAVVASGVDYVNLSVDGASKELFERFRTGAVQEKCLANARRLVAEVRRTGAATQLAVWFDGTAANIHELPDVVRLAGRLGIRTVAVQDLMDWGLPAVGARLAGTAYHDGNQARFDEALAAAARAAREAGVAVWRYASAGTGVRTCQLPWYYLYVTATGLATPCNWNGYDGALNFGNVLTRPLAEIWNSPGYRDFRRALRGPRRPDFCRGCPYYDRVLTRIGG